MFDAIVIGLGGMGSAAAFHLAKRGAKVLGLEQYSPAHDRGSSHGGSRIIRQAYYESPEYVPLLLRTYELWGELEAESGIKLMELTGGLMIGPPVSDVVNGTIASAEEHRLPYETLSADEINRRFPAFRARPEDRGVYEVKAGFVRPEIAVKTHLQLAARHDAALHFGETVLEWSALPSGEGVHVKTDRGHYQADRLILCPGAWAPELLTDLCIPFDVRRHVMCWFQPNRGVARWSPGNLPVYIYDVNGTDCFYGFPAVDGPAGGLKIAMHSGGYHCRPSSLDREISSEDIDELRGYLQEFLPDLNGPFLRGAACMYTLTPDQHFVLSPHPRFAQVAVAAGFSGHGFKFTPVVGEILADLTLARATSRKIDLFSPLRFTTDNVTALA